jgi:hypothetical protein
MFRNFCKTFKQFIYLLQEEVIKRIFDEWIILLMPPGYSNCLAPH